MIKINTFTFNKEGYIIENVPFETNISSSLAVNLNLKFILGEMKRMNVYRCNYNEMLEMFKNIK